MFVIAFVHETECVYKTLMGLYIAPSMYLKVLKYL